MDWTELLSRGEEQEFSGTERFEIESRLGAGGMGVVYRVYDRQRDARVALKLLSNLNPSQLYRFKQEFRALVDVVHPNLVVLYELMTESGQWFFTMELVDGVDFLEYVRGPSEAETSSQRYDSPYGASTTREARASMPGEQGGGPGERTVTVTTSGAASGEDIESQLPPIGDKADLSRLASASKQLASAIIKIHETGHLHRDIKPSNVMVTPAGRVVVLDYGVMSEISKPRGRYGPSDSAGTPAYQAPEILRGAPASVASDWYAFGTALYQALVGQRPYFHYPSRHERQRAKQSEKPIAPAAIFAGVPAHLNDLCMDLLACDPSARPDGEEILRRIGAGTAEMPLAIAPAPSLKLFGRNEELAKLHEVFRQVRGGSGRVVFLQGLSGMGKSTVATRFLDTLDDALVFTGRCYERESLPYKALDSLVDALCGYLIQMPAERLEGVLPRDVTALAYVFPALRRVPLIESRLQKDKRGADAPELRRRAFSAMRELIARLSLKRPVVLYVDDLQWGDAESAPLFFELMRPPTPSVLILGCYRSEEAAGSALLEQLLAKESEREPFRSKMVLVDVAKLPPGVAADLASTLIDGTDDDDDLVARVAKDADGSPYLLSELARYVATRHKKSFEGMTIESVLLHRYRQLSSPAQDLLQVVAVAGWRLLQSVSLHAAGIATDGQRVMAELRSGHFVRTDGIGRSARIEPYHDRVREALTSELKGQEQRRWHGCIADALQHEGETSRPEHVYALAHHAYQAKRDHQAQWVLDLNTRAGQLAKESHAYEQAFTCLSRSAEVAARAQLELDVAFHQLFGEVCSSVGRVDTAVQHFTHALERSEDPLQRAAIHYALARIHVGRMHHPAAAAETNRGLQELGRSPIRKSAFDVFAIYGAWRRGRKVETDPTAFGSAKQEERERLKLEVGLYKYASLVGLFNVEPLSMVKAVLRGYAPCARLGLSSEYVELYVAGACACAVKRLRWADQLERRADELATELDDPITTARTKLYLSFAAHGLGKTELAAERAEDCLTNHGTWLENVDFLTGVADHCWNLNMRGFPARAWYWIERGLERATRVGSGSAFTDGHSYRSYGGPALTMTGRFNQAMGLLDAFRDGLRDVAEDRWRWGQYLAHRALSLVLQGKLGAELEEVIEARRAMKLSLRRIPLQLKQYYVAQAYGRLAQYQRVGDEGVSRSRKAVMRAIKELRKVADQETLLCHLAVIEGAVFAHEEKREKADQALGAAAALADETNNPWVHAEVSLVRARLARQEDNDEQAVFHGMAAWRFAHEVGWAIRADAIAEEFGLAPDVATSVFGAAAPARDSRG